MGINGDKNVWDVDNRAVEVYQGKIKYERVTDSI